MSEDVKHPGTFNDAQLETSLRNQEGIWRKLTAIQIVGGFTLSTHDDATPVEDNSLRLLRDPQGNLPPPAGTTLICRGDALISNTATRVATFRTSAAASSSEASGDSSTSEQPPADEGAASEASGDPSIAEPPADDSSGSNTGAGSADTEDTDKENV